MAIRGIFFIALLFLPLQVAFGNVTLNSTLSTNDQNASWLSSSREFAFGFRPIENTNLFMLAIWFNKIPGKTIVWNADISNPVRPGSRVQLTPTGLSLTSPQGQVIWAAEIQETVSYGEMRDAGNFVLTSLNSYSLWESFNNPTDTLLPTQTVDLNSKLSSRLTPTNYTKGRFELYFGNGNLSLSQIAWPTGFRYTKYFDISTSPNDSASQLVFNSSGNIYVETKSGGQLALGLSDSVFYVSRNYYRATLDYFGVFTLYSHPKRSNDNQAWSIVKSVPENICTAFGSDMGSGCCGYNSYCVLENKRPTCMCPEGYSWVDPKDKFGGCQPDFSLGCGADDVMSKGNPEEVYDIKPLEKVNWPFGDYERLINYTEDECRKSCLYDCNCAVVISNTAKDCWKKRLPISNGRLSASEDGTTALIKIRTQPTGYPNPTMKKEDKVQPALSGSLIGSLVINSLFVAMFVSIILLKPKKVAQVF